LPAIFFADIFHATSLPIARHAIFGHYADISLRCRHASITPVDFHFSFDFTIYAFSMMFSPFRHYFLADFHAISLSPPLSRASRHFHAFSSPLRR
jgi:hypothetical protein